MSNINAQLLGLLFRVLEVTVPNVSPEFVYPVFLRMFPLLSQPNRGRAP